MSQKAIQISRQIADLAVSRTEQPQDNSMTSQEVQISWPELCNSQCDQSIESNLISANSTNFLNAPRMKHDLGLYSIDLAIMKVLSSIVYV